MVYFSHIYAKLILKELDTVLERPWKVRFEPKSYSTCACMQILDLPGTRGTATVLNVLELSAGLHKDS